MMNQYKYTIYIYIVIKYKILYLSCKKSKSPKQLPNVTKKNTKSIILAIFECPLAITSMFILLPFRMVLQMYLQMYMNQVQEKLRYDHG